jgi:4-azaleucine resistance transporter AzlC
MVVEHRTRQRSEFIAGVRDQLPILLGVAPFGMIFGALALNAGIPQIEAQAFSLLIFAGSAQFIATGLIAEGTPPLVVVFTILVVNLRHLLYSATMAGSMERLSRPWKALLAWLLTDEAFAVASIRYRRGDHTHAHWYTFGTGLTLWAAWQVSTAIGILLGARIPSTWSLDFFLPLTFLALLTPTLTDRPTWAAALTAGISAVALAWMPLKLSLLCAAALGIAAGIIAENFLERDIS